MRRSPVIAAISSFQTRSIAGLNRSFSTSSMALIASVRICCARGSASADNGSSPSDCSRRSVAA
jgi:hypothetical protein